jgi:hypothetical protein
VLQTAGAGPHRPAPNLACPPLGIGALAVRRLPAKTQCTWEVAEEDGHVGNAAQAAHFVGRTDGGG